MLVCQQFVCIGKTLSHLQLIRVTVEYNHISYDKGKAAVEKRVECKKTFSLNTKGRWFDSCSKYFISVFLFKYLFDGQFTKILFI